MTYYDAYQMELTNDQTFQLLRLAEQGHYRLISLHTATSVQGEINAVVAHYTHIDCVEAAMKHTFYTCNLITDISTLHNEILSHLTFSHGLEWFVDEKSTGFYINYARKKEQ